MLRVVIAKMTLLVSVLISMTIMTMAHADDAFVHRPEVQTYIQYLVKQYHFQQQPLVTLFSAVKIRPQVIRHINKPLEKELWNTYQMLFVNEWRIQHGVKFWNKYAAALQKAEKTYGVPASIIVATIGIETKYGQKTGEYRVMDSLTNLAFSSSPRAPFFRKELTEFLLLSREQHLDPLKIMGSYAGAIGQPQFMPSSYRYYAVNFSNSGKTDLMHDEIDVIGSIANYYKKHGWQTNEPVALPALFLGNRYSHFLGKTIPTQALSLPELAQYGIAPKIKVPRPDLKVKIIELQTRYSKEYWLAFHNFDVIKRYNPSDMYAMAVYQLSTYIADLKERLH